MKTTDLADCIWAIGEEYDADKRAYVPTDEKTHARLMIKHGICAAMSTGRSTYLRLLGLGYIINHDVNGRVTPCYDMEKVCAARREIASLKCFCDTGSLPTEAGENERENENENEYVCVGANPTLAFTQTGKTGGNRE